MRKPFFRKDRQCWFVVGPDGRHIRLDPDEGVAYQKWLRMKEVGNIGHDSPFYAIAEAWAGEHQSLIHKEKFDQIASYVARFAKEFVDKLAKDITKKDVIDWTMKPKPGRLKKVRVKGKPVLDEHGQPKMERGASKPWSRTTRGDAARAIKRVFAWAHNEGKLKANPLASLRVPQGEPRATIITLEQHRQCLALASPAFRAYLIASRCGARPRQIREVRPENVHTLADGRMIWTFKRHKKDDSGKHLVVYLSPCLATLTRIMCWKRRGELFVNNDGNPWLKDTVGLAMRRLRKRAGIKEATVYAYRHSFATDALAAGHSLAIVAELLGHKDTRMVGKVYGHLEQKKSHLLDAVSDTQQKRIQ